MKFYIHKKLNEDASAGQQLGQAAQHWDAAQKAIKDGYLEFLKANIEKNMPEFKSATDEQKKGINAAWETLKQAKDASTMNVALGNVYKAVGEFAAAYDASIGQAKDASTAQDTSANAQQQAQAQATQQPTQQQAQSESVDFKRILNNKLFEHAVTQTIKDNWI